MSYCQLECRIIDLEVEEYYGRLLAQGDIYRKNPTRNVCQVEDNEIMFLSKDTHCLVAF